LSYLVDDFEGSVAAFNLRFQVLNIANDFLLVRICEAKRLKLKCCTHGSPFLTVLLARLSGHQDSGPCNHPA